MKIGIVGYQGSGKSTLFEWLTGIAPDPALGHVGQSAMAAVPDSRIEPLCAIYSPKKITLASLEFVDTPGLNRKHEGNAARLAVIREAGCLVIVTAAHNSSEALLDAERIQEDFLLADMEIVSGRMERLRESVKKPRPNRDQELAELSALEVVMQALEASTPIADAQMTEDQRKATRSFRLLSEKPQLVICNLADDATDGAKYAEASNPKRRVIAAPIGLELELARMSPEDRAEIEKAYKLAGPRKNDVLRHVLEASGQILYFTAGEKEVRSWLLRRGGTALEAADNIHSDLARGFIRSETMAAADLIRLGSEREVKAQNLLRQEPKDYVVKEADILHIRFSV
jgi:ribosome-binding ATPase YchF (GTP1/OBG family)